MAKNQFDAVVIGAGVGGMCTAALLAHGGMRVLLIEKGRYLGGRFSTVTHDGYQCATGGLAVPVSHNMEQVCETVGVDSGVKPSTRVGMWLDGEWHDLSRGGTRKLIAEVSGDEAEASRVVGALNAALKSSAPWENISFRDWLNQYTTNPRIHGIFQATISSLLTVNSHELPAEQYFELIKVIAPLRFGFIEGGSIRLWERLATLVVAAEGEVWTGARADSIELTNGCVTGVRIRKDRKLHDITTEVVISNVGPAGTVALIDQAKLDPNYVKEINEKMTPTAIMWLHFASDELLMDYSAISVGCSRRVNMIDVPSFEADGVAPVGKHLYTVGAAPRDSLNPGDIKQEFAEVMRDLDEIFPDFERRCRVLTSTCYRGKWPGFRTVPGKHVGHQTPIPNLYNVGDAACPAGFEGSMGAAKSAQLVCEAILAT